jgi:hypothetical protein
VYPVTAARKFADTLSPILGPERRFRFVYTSGALAERDQQKQLWAMRSSRLVKVREALIVFVPKLHAKVDINM